LINFITSNGIILLISAVKAETRAQSTYFIKRFIDSRGKREFGFPTLD
jgi:hypothetical protein